MGSAQTWAAARDTGYSALSSNEQCGNNPVARYSSAVVVHATEL